MRRRWAWISISALSVAVLPGIGGLGYESSLILSPLFAAIGAMAGLDQVRRSRAEATPSPSALVARLTRELAALHGLALAILIFAGTLHGDAWWRELPFYALGPVASSGVGAVAGLWGAALGERRSVQWTLSLAPQVLATALVVWRLYHDPAVFAFDAFGGYFAGPIYDQGVQVDLRLALFRTYNAAASLFWLLLWWQLIDRDRWRIDLSRARRLSRRLTGVLLVLGLPTAVIAVAPQHFGFHATTGSIRQTLSATRVTEHFEIFYEPDSETADEIDAIALEHEFAWHRLQEALGREPQTPVQSFNFETPAAKRELMGAADTEVAPPWRRQMYLDSVPFPPESLHHELVHVFQAPLGDPLFGLSLRFPRLNMGLVEGFAVALEEAVIEGLDVHDQAAILERLDQLPPLTNLMGLQFWTERQAIAYTAAGSFCRWIADGQGMTALIDLYSSAGDFERVCGEPLADLERRWLAFLRARPLDPNDIELFRPVYQQPTLFERRNTHRVEALLRHIRGDLRQGRFDLAVDRYREALQLEPQSASLVLGLARALCGANRFDEAERELAQLDGHAEISVTERVSIDELIGDIAVRGGDYTYAEGIYGRALGHHMSEGLRRVILLKRRGASDPALAPLVAEYFRTFEPEFTPEVARALRSSTALKIVLLPDHAAIGRYLIGRQRLLDRSAEDAVELFQAALSEPEALPGPEFVRNARRWLLNASCQTGDYELARATLEQLRADPVNRSSRRLEYDRWEERIDFFESFAGDEMGQ